MGLVWTFHHLSSQSFRLMAQSEVSTGRRMLNKPLDQLSNMGTSLKTPLLLCQENRSYRSNGRQPFVGWLS